MYALLQAAELAFNGVHLQPRKTGSPCGARCLGGVRRRGLTVLWQVQVHCKRLLAFYVGGQIESPFGRRWPPPAGRTPRAGLGPLGPLASWGPGPRGTRGTPFGPFGPLRPRWPVAPPRRATFGPRLFNLIHYRNLQNAKPVAPSDACCLGGVRWWGAPRFRRYRSEGKVSFSTIT